jgi:hypothetical protein
MWGKSFLSLRGFSMTFPWPVLRRHGTAVAAMLVGMFVLWSLLWTIAAAQHRGLVDNWLAAEKARGHVVAYDRRETNGFPDAITLRFVNLRWQDGEGGKAQAGDVTLTTHPLRWRAFDITFGQGASIAIPFPDNDDPVGLQADSGEGHIELNADNSWAFVRLRFNAAAASRPSRRLFTADMLEVAVERPDRAPRDYTEIGLGLAGKTTNMTVETEIPMPFGDKIAGADVAFRVMGPAPDVYSRESIATWNNNSGMVECDAFNLEWGPLSLATRGTLALDDDLQPEGAFAGHIGDHAEVIKTLQEQNWIAKRQAGMLNSALGLFAKPSTLTGKPSIEVPITVQMGGLFLGPVRIFTFPEIAWPKSP